MSQWQTISIIIPVYNEQAYITRVVEGVIAANTLELAKEIIIVDDGSTDQTGPLLRKINRQYQAVTVLSLPDNQGKGAAVKKGILASQGDIVLIQDADLEYRPSDYPKLIQPLLDREADAVYGSRFISPQAHRVLFFWHRVANGMLTLLSNTLTNFNLTDIETGYKAFRGRLARSLAQALKAKRFGFEPEITARLAKIPNIRLFEVGIAYYGRTYQAGKKIKWTDGLKAIGEIIKYNLLVK